MTFCSLHATLKHASDWILMDASHYAHDGLETKVGPEFSSISWLIVFMNLFEL